MPLCSAASARSPSLWRGSRARAWPLSRSKGACCAPPYPGAPPPRIDVCRGRPVEISESTVGEVVAVDVALTPLSDYDTLA